MPATFSGVWQPGSKNQFVLCNWNEEKFVAKIPELVNDGFHLTSLCSTIDGAKRQWHGVVTKSEQDDREAVLDLDIPLDENQIPLRIQEMLDRGFGFGCIDSQLVAGKPAYSIFWTRDAKNRDFTLGRIWTTFDSKLRTASTRQLVPLDISTIFDGTQRRWSAVFTRTDDPEDFAFLVDADLQSLINQSQSLANRNSQDPAKPDLYLARLIAYRGKDASVRYGALFREGRGLNIIESNASSSELIASKQDRQAQSHLADIEGLSGFARAGTATSADIRLHIRFLFHPTVSEHRRIKEQIENAKRCYRKHGLEIAVFPIKVTPKPGLKSIRLKNKKCKSGKRNLSADQKAVFALRDSKLKKNDIVIYVVRNVIGLAGCAAHPNSNEPGAIVETQSSSAWTLAHELGHVLGLLHMDGDHKRSNRYLMYTPTYKLNKSGLPKLSKNDLKKIDHTLNRLDS